MTDCRKVFLDTAPLIYLLDNDANYIQKIRLIFTELLEAGIPIVSSVITCEEYLVFPFRTNNREKIAAFCEFVSDCGIVLRNIDRETADEIRKEICMTKVAMIFEEEKQEALEKLQKQNIIRMIQKNYDTEEIISLFPEFSHSRVEALRQELAAGVKDIL